MQPRKVVSMLTTLAEKVDPANAALVIIDWQNDFWVRNAGDGPTPDMKVLAGVPEATEKLRVLIDAARQARLPVVWVGTHHSADLDSEVWIERRREREHFRPREGTWGADWYGGIAPADGEPVVIKNRWSAFINTDLHAVLQGRGIKSLIVTGGSANGCVEKTALDGFQMDYYIVAAPECMATSHPDSRNMQETFSYGVVASNDEIIACWSKVAAPTS
jgi:ureidoacrylate peracid hydrolase